ncbi:MAG: hypothetical protein ACK4PK_04350 [Alphaproteobacteria bacterium]|jgi:hypothetical protein
MGNKDFNRNSNPITQDDLDRLKAARAADPNWEKAIARAVEAEAALSPKDDPAEGKIIISKSVPKPQR